MLGRLHDEGQVMNDEATNAQVGAIGMGGRGRRPRADEWECVHCGLVIDDGDRAPSHYCEEGDE